MQFQRTLFVGKLAFIARAAQSSGRLVEYNIGIQPAEATGIVGPQSADSTVSSFVDSSAQHRGMRPNLVAMKNTIFPKPNLNQARIVDRLFSRYFKALDCRPSACRIPEHTQIC